MDERLSVKDIVAGVLGMIGVVLFVCDSDDLMLKIFVSLGGLALWGLAYLVWKVWTILEEVNND